MPLPLSGDESDATVRWYNSHDAYHKASEAYNQRLALVRSERERGNWSMTVDAEYRALNDAQKAALAADADLYRALHCALARVTAEDATQGDAALA